MDIYRWKANGVPVRVGDQAVYGETTGTVTLLSLETIFVDGKPVWPRQIGAERIHPPPTEVVRESWPTGTNPAMICPHCQTKGFVSTKQKKVKQGISGGKAVAAVVTGGLSMITPGIGLSRKEKVTEATCGRCGSIWRF